MTRITDPRPTTITISGIVVSPEWLDAEPGIWVDGNDVIHQYGYAVNQRFYVSSAAQADDIADQFYNIHGYGVYGMYSITSDSVHSLSTTEI